MGKDEALSVKMGDDTRSMRVGELGANVRRAQDNLGPDVNSAVVISADRNVKYEVVVKVMDALQRAGVQHVGLSVQLVN